MFRRLFGKQEEKTQDELLLEESLQKTRGGVLGRIGTIFQANEITDELWDELEETLIMADVGMETTAELVEKTRARVERDAIKATKDAYLILKREMVNLLKADEPLQIEQPRILTVVLVVGVNGSGKTTTIGKLAYRYKQRGKKVVLAAGDDLHRDGHGDAVAPQPERGQELAHRGPDGDFVGLTVEQHPHAHRPAGRGRRASSDSKRSGLLDAAMACSRVISRRRARVRRAISMVCMPSPRPACMLDSIWNSLFSRMRFRIAGFTIMISWAAARPLPVCLRRSCWVTTAMREVDTMVRTCACCSWG